MTDIIPSRSMIQAEAVAARAAVSESLLTIVGAESNFTNTYQNNSKSWWLNGVYKGSNLLGIDGIFIFPFNAEVVGFSMSNLISGSSGTTSVSLKKIATPGAAPVNIFSASPSFDATSPDNTWLVKDLIDGNDIQPTGAILPTFSTTLFSKGEGVRADINSTMLGAQTLGMTLYFRVINP